VFVKADGTSMHPDIFSQLFDRTVAKIDVPTSRCTTCATRTPPCC
jgi:hypothetical protein